VQNGRNETENKSVPDFSIQGLRSMKRHITNIDIFPYGKQKVERARGVKKLLLGILPYHTLFPLKCELRMALVRLRSLGKWYAYKTRKDLLVNIGAGAHGQDGWINIDAYHAKNIHCVFDVRKRLPFADHAVKGIFCEHFLEHLDYTEEVPYFLSECHRVLRPGGVLRIIVPDAERYLAAYARGGWEELTRMRPLDEKLQDHWFHHTYNTRMELINVVFRQGYDHRFAYDYETLEFVLRRYGFREVQQQSYRRSNMPELCIDQEVRASESLYVEGVKT
jgi:predicted SAM-dependent methyltransferase